MLNLHGFFFPVPVKSVPWTSTDNFRSGYWARPDCLRHYSHSHTVSGLFCLLTCIDKNNKSIKTPLTCDPAQNSAAAQERSCASSCLTNEARRSQSLFNSKLSTKKSFFSRPRQIFRLRFTFICTCESCYWLLYVSVARDFFYQDRGQLSADKYRRVGPRDRRVTARRLWRHPLHW